MMKSTLRKGENPEEDWDLLLPFSLFACRSSVHTAMGYSPFLMMFGREMRGPLAALKELWTLPTKAPASAIQSLDATRKRLETAFANAREREELEKTRAKAHYDKGAKEDPLEDVLLMHPEGPGLSAKWADLPVY